MPSFTDHSSAPFPFGSCLSWLVIFVIVTLFGLMRMKNPGDGVDPKPESRHNPKFSATTIGAASPGLFVDVGFSELTDFEPTLDEERPLDADLPRPMEIFHNSPVPPFLSKTYEIVADRALDPIISWGCSGESFVVWDPVEFARVVLPRNFKHNNFSSFARQLNTYVGICPIAAWFMGCRDSSLFFCQYGFRKVDADRWEFANEGFQRGKKHLLKNIQRRKSPKSQQPGCYSGHSIETARPGVESEVEKLKTEKTILMKEVIELQQQQRGTAHHAQSVSQRIQVAEQKQKQMVSFLAKLLKNPSFVERLKERKEHKKIGSSRSKRNLLGRGRTEWDEANPLVEGQVVEHGHSWANLDDSSCFFMEDPLCSDLPEFVSEDWIGMQRDSETGSSQTVGFWSKDPVLPHDSSLVQGNFQNPPLVGEGSSMVAAWDAKGKSPITSGDPPAAPECFVSFLEDLEGKRSFTGFSSGFESIVKQEEIWSMGFDVSATMSIPGGEPWDNIPPFNEPVQGVTAGLSDIWDLGQLPASRELGGDNWPEEPESEADQQEDSTSKENDP